ncbi:MAG TPA: DUF6067 family protein [Planctomycetota bacterium]|nr:DUF6067 family protein [Planctomycetota bacterium]
MKLTLPLVLLLSAGLAGASRGGEPAPSGPVILDGSGTLWRSFVVWKTPAVLAADGKVRPLTGQQYFWWAAERIDGKGQPLADWRSAPAPEGWTAPEFDDGDWPQSAGPQGPGYRAKDWQHPGFSMWSDGSPAQVNAVYARAKFRVADPTKAGNLKLTLRYQGGAVVYMNGKEIARGNLSEGKLDLDALAAPYPDDAYLGADGKPCTGEANAKSTPEQLAQFEKRVRRLEVEVPASALRAGVNVLAVELRRAAYKEIWRAPAKEYQGGRFCEWPWPWPHCRLIEARLAAPAASDAVAANAGRPVGIQLWRPHPWATVTGLSYGDPCEGAAPLRLVGFRNGAFSAQLVVSSTEAFSGLAVTATDLAGEKGSKLPASCVLLRHPETDGLRFDALLDKPPAQVPVREYRAHREAPAQKVAMQPVWVTVKVPADAAPGEYQGKVRVEAQGLAAVEVPLAIKVHDWRLPDAKDLVAHNNLWQSQESVAARYKVPLWSDRHFELMGRCLELSAPLANKYCNVHLVKGAFCIGNTESIVRWIDKGDGKYDHDFAPFDKYLDLYEKTLGKPKVLLVDVCVSIHSSNRPKDGSCPVKVSRLDPATGKVEPMGQPPLKPDTGVAFWKPVLDGVKARLEKRGWWDVTLIGTASDSGPGKEEAQVFKEIWPDKAWLFSGHPKTTAVAGGAAPVKCMEWVWGAGSIWNPAGGEGFMGGPNYPAPWKRRDYISVAFPRLGAGACELYGYMGSNQPSPLGTYRLFPEKAMQCGQDGIGRVGLNFWEFTDEGGRKRQLDFGQGTGQFFFNTGVSWFLGAGPDGPVPTTRSEMFREGLQVREAMTFLQQAADGGKLPAEMAARMNELLRQRATNMIRELGDGHREWRENENRLFALCAEAAKVAGGK